MNDFTSTQRLIARVIRDVLKSGPFNEFADFKDALRRRLSALKIHCSAFDFDEAVTVVQSNAALWRPTVKPAQSPPEPDGRPIGKAEAMAILGQLHAQIQGGRLRAQSLARRTG